MAGIRLKRGTKANLPTLAVGEPALCTDTGELYIGYSSGNLPVSGTVQALNLDIPVDCADGISKSVSGSYVRCGDMVTVGVTFSVETATTLTGTLAITGLPFTAKYDAYAALVEYNKNPYDLDDDLTVEQLYEKWTDEYFKTLTNPSSIRTIKSAWNYCSAIYNMRAKDLRPRHIKGCMEDGTYVVDGVEKKASSSTKTKIKSLFNLMLDYANENDLVEKNYARTFKLSDDIIKDVEEEKKDHIDFTDEEMQKLWNNLYDVDYVDVLLIQCYSGWRPQELGLLKMENVDLENWFITGGMKTDAGKDRVVPVHPKIRSLIKHRYQEALSLGSEYLINCTDTKTHRSSLKLTYDKYRHRVEKIVNKLELNPEHRAHDGRIQFATMAKDAKVNEYALKRIIGHKIDDLTEKTYTKRKREWLMEEILKIKQNIT